MTLPITATFIIHVVKEIINVDNVDLGSFIYVCFNRSFFFVASMLCCCEILRICCNVTET